VVARPFALLLVPPHKLLALTPGLPVRPRGGAVVEDAAVRRPSKGPAMGVDSGRLAPVGPVFPRLGKDARVDPAAARRGPVRLQVRKAANELAIGDRPAVDLLEDLLDVGLPMPALGPVVPPERIQSGVSRTRVARGPLLQP